MGCLLTQKQQGCQHAHEQSRTAVNHQRGRISFPHVGIYVKQVTDRNQEAMKRKVASTPGLTLNQRNPITSSPDTMSRVPFVHK